MRQAAERGGQVAPGGRRFGPRVPGDADERRLGVLAILLLAAAREDDGRGARDARIRIVDERSREPRGILAANRGERADRRGAHVGARVSQHPLDRRQPACRHVRADARERRQRARPDGWRGVVEQQRRDQIALVQRFEHVDRVDDARFVRMGQFFDERLDRHQVRHCGPQIPRVDPPGLQALPEASQVLLPCAQRQQGPESGDEQVDVGELPPAETEPLDRDDEQERAETLGEPIDRHVREGLGLILHARRERHEQDLARGLVHVVAKRRVHARGRRPTSTAWAPSASGRRWSPA